MANVAGVTHRIDAQGCVRVVFDHPQDKVNLLTVEILEEMARLLDDVREREEVRGVLFESAKSGSFLAGMDVDAIAAAPDAYSAAEGSRRGQGVFSRIASLPFPSVAVLSGSCLGGGMELALACTVRIAADDPSLRLGFPEVRLGIIPGFGGTQRLPRVVGLAAALELIVSGRPIDVQEARRIGLVDRVVPVAYLGREALSLLAAAADRGPKGFRRRPRPLIARGVERLVPMRRLLLARARRGLSKRVAPDRLPAAFRAIEAIGASCELPLGQGLDLEARIVGDLVPTPAARNLLWLFKNQGDLKKSLAGARAIPRKVRRAAVVGAGIMGSGLACAIADRHIPVRLQDVRGDALLSALRHARETWEETRRRERLPAREVESRLGFISPTRGDTGLRRVDLVVEAVVEDLEIKQKVLAAVEGRVGERTVFASNTSSLPITEIASKALRPERVVGLHFFNPVDRMVLVEVIAGRRTAPEAVATAHRFALDLGKVPILVRDSPGFLVNRILTVYMSEAMRLLEEGFRIADVDGAMRDFGMPVGPFALMDRVGLDTANQAASILQATFGKRLGVSTGTLAALQEAGRLGQKSGSGFYRYSKGRLAAPDPSIHRLVGSPSPRALPAETLQERLVLAMANEAAVCIEDGVVEEPRDVDVGMVLGAGFPAFRGGPLRYADSIGLPVLVDRLSRLADSQGERFRPAGLLREMVREERRFYPEPRRQAPLR